MGFYIKKSFSVGLLRLNLSKSGIGALIGIRGLRVGAGPRGNYVHIGRGGLYYRAFTSRKSPQPSRNRTAVDRSVDSVHDPSLGLTSQIDSYNLLSINDSTSDDVLEDIRRKHRKHVLWPWVAVGSFVIIVVFPWLWPIVTLLVPTIIIDWRRKRSLLVYSVDDHMDLHLENFYAATKGLIAAASIYHLQSQTLVLNRKYHAGADHLVKRNKIRVTFRRPINFKTNVMVVRIPVGKQIMYLFPDRLLLFDKRAVASVSYELLQLQLTSVMMIEEGSVPTDASIVGHTWRYVNKNGSPDRRFRNNPELPKVQYAELRFTSTTGLNELIQVSAVDAAKQFKEALISLAKQLSLESGTT